MYNKAIRNRLINKITYRDRKEIAQYSELVFFLLLSSTLFASSLLPYIVAGARK